jgi:hypothetical protein
MRPPSALTASSWPPPTATVRCDSGPPGTHDTTSFRRPLFVRKVTNKTRGSREHPQVRYADPVPRGRSSGGGDIKEPLPVAARVLRVRFNINWQWPAIEMQYERLIARLSLPPERLLAEHMRMVADMDLFVTSVRRLLRTAQSALRIPSDCQPQLKLAVKIFDSRWGMLTDVRNALEHPDGPGMFPVPAIGLPTSGRGNGDFIFMWPGGNLNLGRLYEDARSITRAIVSIIEPIEAECDKPQTA